MIRRYSSLVLLCLILLGVLSPYQRSLWSLPEELRIKEGAKYTLDFKPPFGVSVGPDRSGPGERRSPEIVVKPLGRNKGIQVTGQDTGVASLDVRFLGLIPLRQVRLAVVPETKVIPGGHSIGLVLKSKGVTVSKVVPVEGESGKRFDPAGDAGLRLGDVILRCNGVSINSDEHLSYLIEEAGRSGNYVRLEGKHPDGSTFDLKVKPVKCKKTGRYLIGAWVRDGMAGVGTLTFYDPDTGCYAALGHTVMDLESSRPVDIREGRIVKASVSAIDQGRRGRPGEKIGVFVDERDVIGSIDRNTRFGIIGTLNVEPVNPFFEKPISVALPEQVRIGPAEVFTVVEGQKIGRFRCEILKVKKQSDPGSKGIVIKITDPELLAKTGGIVQGMSGSPVVQDGTLVGAITHVFVNDPSKGYGVFAEWMLREAYGDSQVDIVGQGKRLHARRIA
ncbi:MAG TPA: SpoIVB peptidase [Clostridia bacterium]|nr:SpoIVB peptidase [Clostridia bacterium]